MMLMKNLALNSRTRKDFVKIIHTVDPVLHLVKKSYTSCSHREKKLSWHFCILILGANDGEEGR